MQTLPMTDELSLVRAAQNDAQAFGALYDQYIQRVYRYCQFRTNNRHDAEDLTAQIFLAAIEGLPRYRQDGHFAAWLFSIARRKVADFHRRTPHLPLHESLLPLLDADLALNLEKSQRQERLRSLIRALPEDDQELIRLRYVAELPFSEIARAIRKSEDAVKKMLYRLIARLRRDLEADHE